MLHRKTANLIKKNPVRALIAFAYCRRIYKLKHNLSRKNRRLIKGNPKEILNST